MALLPDVKYDRHLRAAPLCWTPPSQRYSFGMCQIFTGSQQVCLSCDRLQEGCGHQHRHHSTGVTLPIQGGKAAHHQW